MSEDFDLHSYLNNGIARIVKSAQAGALKNPAESLFLARFALACRHAAAKRRTAEEAGEHVPPFLIASITSQCNLHCAGCYARANHACNDAAAVRQLSGEQWENIFEQARELGVSFILLAGGEPMLRRDVLEAAGRVPEIVFPVFTNGVLLDGEAGELFLKKRNLVPVLSIEGGREATDRRRGAGMYDRLCRVMQKLGEKGVLYGASITVTRENLSEVTGAAFLDTLCDNGCKAIIFVEYVPVSPETADLAPGEAERAVLNQAVERLRREREGVVSIAFPGDEKTSGGCLAAGRGFFHINSHGGAEPCPFSPYSDINVCESSLREALRSRLFTRLREDDVLMEEHEGGCVLFEKREEVEAILREANA